MDDNEKVTLDDIYTVDTYIATNSGYSEHRRDDDILNDLVEEFNKLLTYLKEKS